jgi:hypothetical protein
MQARFVVKERDRGIADYADCIDDDLAIIDDDWAIVDDDIAVIDDDEAIIDDDETVCDDDRDGLTPEEAEAYNKECKMLSELRAQLIGILGWSKFKEWCYTYN